MKRILRPQLLLELRIRGQEIDIDAYIFWPTETGLGDSVYDIRLLLRFCYKI